MKVALTVEKKKKEKTMSTLSVVYAKGVESDIVSRVVSISSRSNLPFN